MRYISMYHISAFYIRPPGASTMPYFDIIMYLCRFIKQVIMEKFRVGIIGAGHIAEKMAWTLTQMDQAQAYAVASRSIDKAR